MVSVLIRVYLGLYFIIIAKQVYETRLYLESVSTVSEDESDSAVLLLFSAEFFIFIRCFDYFVDIVELSVVCSIDSTGTYTAGAAAFDFFGIQIDLH